MNRNSPATHCVLYNLDTHHLKGRHKTDTQSRSSEPSCHMVSATMKILPCYLKKKHFRLWNKQMPLHKNPKCAKQTEAYFLQKMGNVNMYHEGRYDFLKSNLVNNRIKWLWNDRLSPVTVTDSLSDKQDFRPTLRQQLLHERIYYYFSRSGSLMLTIFLYLLCCIHNHIRAAGLHPV